MENTSPLTVRGLVICIDPGRVALDRERKNGKPMPIKDYKRSKMVRKAISRMWLLVQFAGAAKVYFVKNSKTSALAVEALGTLRLRRVFKKTGIPEENYRPCVSRPDKARICAELGATHVVDDRAWVLKHAKDGTHVIWFRPLDKDVRNHAAELFARASRGEIKLTLAWNWDEVDRAILGDCSEEELTAVLAAMTPEDRRRAIKIHPPLGRLVDTAT